MTLLSATAAAPLAPALAGRRRVTLLSGFLGSGKTTLLRRELQLAGSHAPAVIVNDFGRTLVDEGVLSTEGEAPATVSGGCACCTRRDDLARALADLLDAEQRGAAQRRDHVVIETSGLSDPGPIAFTVANDPVLKHHYALAGVCVTVDALTGLNSLEHHPVALHQLLAADEVFVTKTDLIDPEHLEPLVSRLHELNPSARINITSGGDVLRTEAPIGTTTRRATTLPATEADHTSAFSTLELAVDEQLDWQAFAIWLSLLLHGHGPDILRVKGVLDVRGVGRVAVNGIQHIVHKPEHLTGPGCPGTRLVLIVRNLDIELLERSFRTLVGIR